MPLTLSKQVEILIKYIKELSAAEIRDDVNGKVFKWVRDLPAAGRPPELLALLKAKFELSDSELDARLEKPKQVEDFDSLVPESGWLHDYVQYTRNTEPPTVFHFFAGMVAIGSSLARNVYYDMGPYQIFPNLNVIIVAPSGKCRKTSACNVAVGLYRAIGGNVLADKVTPEALISAFQDRGSATGLIYAPELAVFLSKQKYNEGMIPLLTALFDCPKEWNSLTIMRGEGVLRNVAISMLGCSTMDWIQNAIPRDAFGGGFMSRLVFIVQNTTPRSFPHPPPLDKAMEHKLKAQLMGFSKFKGQFQITADADEWYVDWYNSKSSQTAVEKQFAGYMERKADHLHRLAMILTVSELPIDRHEGLTLTLPRMRLALQILNWVESHLPGAFSEMTQNSIGEEHTRMLKQLKAASGQLSHSEWLRMNSNRMNSRQFKEATDTMRSAKLVDYDSVKRAYSLTPEGWTR